MKNIFVNKLSNLIKSSVLVSLFGAIFVAGNVTAGGHESAEESPHEWSANMAILSEYSFRGISQSNEDPAIQVGIDYGHASGLYVGFWASSVEFNDGPNATQIETNFYTGYGGSAGSIDYDIGFLYYYYPEEDADEPGSGLGEQDLFEIYGSLGTSFDAAYEPSITAGFAYSPDYYGSDGDSIYIYGEFGFALGPISPYATVAYLDVEGDKTTPAGYDYVSYTIGASYDIGQFTLDLHWSDKQEGTDHGGSGSAHDAVIFGISSSW